ncbi:hypothetical protein OIV83_003672 [Microbotryomycetes sp. JL201]|nr:hypothetical protein OIV83_003672 [Microbotryomycetes sp. JL201]
MLPVIDLDAFLTGDDAIKQTQGELTAQALIRYGALIVKDSRVSEQANEHFLDVLEDYFDQEEYLLEQDLRPQWGWQTGVTLESTEKPKCHSSDACKAVIASLEPEERPIASEAGQADPKCRFFYRMGVAPPETDFKSLSMENVIPERFTETWQQDMEAWGNQMKTSVETVAQALAVGLGLNELTLLQAAEYGSHLLAPTSTDLRKYGREGEIFAGFHTDLNALTIHGRSRYPGLHIWARNTGKKIAVKVPPGHLLVQAGMQLEHLTAGLIKAGYHEVVCTRQTLEAIERRQADLKTKDRPSIRISSTFFWHFSSDYVLRPQAFVASIQGSRVVREEQERIMKDLESSKGAQRPAMAVPKDEYEEDFKVGELVQRELRHIALMT